MSDALKEIPPLVAKNDSFYRRRIYPYRKHYQICLLFLPVMIYFFVFHYGPMYGIIIAFKNYQLRKGILGSPWVGLENFSLLLSARGFLRAFTNTLILSILRLGIGFPIPILFAILLNEVRSLRLKKTFQTLSYLPHFLSWIILAGLFKQFLSPSMGAANQVIMMLGFKPIYFLADPAWFRFALISTGIWKGVGWGSIIYLATISGINEEIFEAAVIDGAGRMRQTLHVTIPSLLPVITIMLILAVGGILNDSFDQIFNLYNPAVYSVGDVISTYVYRIGLVDMKYGFATAVGLFKNIIGLILVLTTNFFARRVSEYGLW